MTPTSLPALRRRTVLGGAFTLSAVGAATALAAPAHAETEPPSDPNLEQTVSSDEQVIEGEHAVLERGHVDLGPLLLDGEWTACARDDTANPPVWRRPEDVVMRVVDDGALELPEGEEYAFTGAAGGDRVWSVPQVEVPGVVWLGWNTQDPAVVAQDLRGVRLRFHSAQGPGQVSLFLQPGNFAPPEVLVDPAVTEPQEVFVEMNTHTHANWVFTKPGVYLLDLEIEGEHQDGSRVAASTTLRFAIGTDTDPQLALEETWADGTGPQARLGAADTGTQGASDAGGASDGGAGGANAAADGSSSAGAEGDDDQDAGGSGTLLIAGGIAAAAAVVGGGAAVVQRRRSASARAAAWDDSDPQA